MGESKINEAIQRAEAQNQMPVQQPDRLQKLIDWVISGKTRKTVNVTIGDTDGSHNVKIWAYDYDLQYGEHIDINHINDISKIDFKANKETEQQREYEALKAKFEKGDNDANKKA